MVKVGVLGYGTVGSGVVEILDKNKDIIAKRVGKDVSVKYVLDLRDFPETRLKRYWYMILRSLQMTRRFLLL